MQACRVCRSRSAEETVVTNPRYIQQVRGDDPRIVEGNRLCARILVENFILRNSVRGSRMSVLEAVDDNVAPVNGVIAKVPVGAPFCNIVVQWTVVILDESIARAIRDRK